MNRLFFAGEHCSSAPAWIEGAIESGLGAVEDLTRYGAGLRARCASGHHDPAGAL
ncbi:FAD-dependent oxidoreductase [Streptomyces sp. ISL-11]|uniref:FAD-dependent oxidoreductase n=1 Tax=Streptomyces sp. ISL-11 TaxID=2819174 RepID=UPI0027E410A2|nr:FAD-dependent oxidoreductase [Streptomyces sp. ISL-11]